MPKTWLNVPHRTQSKEAGCLPACAEMILASFGHLIDQEYLARLLGTSWLGTPSSNIKRLISLGYAVTYGEASLEEVATYLKQEIPAITFVRTGDLPHWQTDTAHAVVVVGIDQCQVYVNDPYIAEAPQSIPKPAFLLAWARQDYTFAAIRPVSPHTENKE